MGSRSIAIHTATGARPRAARRASRTAVIAMVPTATIVALLLATLPLAPVAAQEHAEAATAALEEGYRAKAERDAAAARRAFERALALGADPQRVHLELGYVAAAQRRMADARRHFETAAGGPNAELAGAARTQLRFVPNHLWADVYFEGWAWYRFAGARSANFVPTLRLRGLWRPFLDADFNLYLYGQITRDIASRGVGPRSLPVIYADNHALLGAGIFYRFLENHAAVFGQLGPAFNLRDDGGEIVSLDARVGVLGGIASDECRLPHFNGMRLFIGGCVEGYGEIVYVSRFNHDIVGMVRGRVALNLLQVGPMLWQPLFELRALGGKNGDYYNNLAELGVGYRFRLLEPFLIDLTTTLHGGLYYGVQNVDPVPNPPVFLELRALLTTYAEITP